MRTIVRIFAISVRREDTYPELVARCASDPIIGDKWPQTSTNEVVVSQASWGGRGGSRRLRSCGAADLGCPERRSRPHIVKFSGTVSELNSLVQWRSFYG